MTKERLEELARKLPRSADRSPVSEYNEIFDGEEAAELVRLAKIGLWAEEVGARVPFLTTISSWWKSRRIPVKPHVHVPYTYEFTESDGCAGHEPRCAICQETLYLVDE